MTWRKRTFRLRYSILARNPCRVVSFVRNVWRQASAFCDDLYDAVVESAKTADDDCGDAVYWRRDRTAHCVHSFDRLFYSASELLEYKPAAAVAVCRRGGASAAFDRLNKYFSINNMPIVTSQYWNIVYGRLPGEVSRDAEGLQTMRTLFARNMAWMLEVFVRRQTRSRGTTGNNFISISHEPFS